VLSRERSALSVTEEWLSRIAEAEPWVRSFVTVDAKGAKAAAAALDEQLASGSVSSSSNFPLLGVPLAVKDTLATKGLRTTAGSALLRKHVPNFDATAVARARAAGAVVAGKANCDEFAMGSTTESSFHQPSTRNPWDLSRVPGGSSGGSAAAVSARQVPAALGSDTGGSIRQPASYCGVVGIKPSYGSVSRHGLLAYGSSLDCVGPLAGCVEDAALLLDVVAGKCRFDATSNDRRGGESSSSSSSSSLFPLSDACVPIASLSDSKPLRGLRVGVIAEAADASGLSPGVSSAFSAAVAHFEALGAEVGLARLPSASVALPAYYVIATAEASSNLARYDSIRFGERRGSSGEGGGGGREDGSDTVAEVMAAARRAGFGPEVKRRILMGTYALSAGYVDAYYARAQRVRSLVRRQMSRALSSKEEGGGGGGGGGFDVLVAPVAPTVAPALAPPSSSSSAAEDRDPLQMYLGDVMTVTLNLAGLPGICVPCGFAPAEGGEERGAGAAGGKGPLLLPVGLQIIGRAGLEGEVAAVRAAHVFEQTAAFSHLGAPPHAAAGL
jgi:aspartyl-tRNA(Asn)/glutamyl-tRNA(Gln) amidotransferase subunit A